MGLASLLCLEDGISCQASWSPGSYGLLTSSSIMFPEPYMEGLIIISIFFFIFGFILFHVCECFTCMYACVPWGCAWCP